MSTLRKLVLAGFLLGTVSSCATTGPRVLECGSRSNLPPLPDDSCQADPDVHDYARQLFDLIRGDVGVLLVRVHFDRNAEIQGVCADRTSVKGSWKHRYDVGGRLHEVFSLQPVPACLANTRLDFNRTAAVLADIDGLLAECRREAQGRFEAETNRGAGASPTTFSHAHLNLKFCVEQHQIRRDEMWFFDGVQSVPVVFESAAGSSDRRTVLLDCSESMPPLNRSALETPIGMARAGPGVRECMIGHGWEPAY